jgi:hypothetical protein
MIYAPLTVTQDTVILLYFIRPVPIGGYPSG